MLMYGPYCEHLLIVSNSENYCIRCRRTICP
jgi:hypothetical protein